VTAWSSSCSCPFAMGFLLQDWHLKFTGEFGLAHSVTYTRYITILDCNKEDRLATHWEALRRSNTTAEWKTFHTKLKLRAKPKNKAIWKPINRERSLLRVVDFHLLFQLDSLWSDLIADPDTALTLSILLCHCISPCSSHIWQTFFWDGRRRHMCWVSWW